MVMEVRDKIVRQLEAAGLERPKCLACAGTGGEWHTETSGDEFWVRCERCKNIP